MREEGESDAHRGVLARETPSCAFCVVLLCLHCLPAGSGQPGAVRRRALFGVFSM